MDKEPVNKAERRRNLRLLYDFTKGSRLMFVISFSMAVISAFVDMITPQIIRIAIDNVIGGEEPHLARPVMKLIDAVGGFERLSSALWILSIAILVVATVKVVSQYVYRVSTTAAAETLVKTMRDRIYHHIERLPFNWHMQNRTGDIIQRCTSDLETVKNFTSEQLTNIFRICIMLVLALVFMFSMNVGLTVIAIIPMPIILIYSMNYQKSIRTNFKECDEAEGRLSTMVQENLTGVRVVRAFGRERYERDRFETFNDSYTNLWVRLSKIMSFFWSTADVLSALQVMLIVIFGALFCVRGQMTSGEYVAFISYNGMLVWPIRMLGRMLTEFSKSGVAIDRVGYIMFSEEEQDSPAALTPPMDQDIAFEHVTFAYDGTAPVLSDVSFTVKAGTTLGILGGTGSGKSTMMLLLNRLYPLKEGGGRITIGGVDIADIDTHHLRKNIGMVLQEPYLFSRSLAENIGITREDADLSDIRAAADAACLDETILSFSKGYDTFVGERGVTLSGGQKQRAAIARTLMQDTPIMIFDDSLSAVDTETDAKIRAALEKRFGSATIILISHRITTLSKADQILVLDQGRVAECGTHEELAHGGGLYQQIFEIQSLPEEEVLA